MRLCKLIRIPIAAVEAYEAWSLVQAQERAGTLHASAVQDAIRALRTRRAIDRFWLRLSSLRLDRQANAPPVGVTDAYVDTAFADVPELARKSPGVLVSSLIEERCERRIAEVHQDIAAVALPDRPAEPLRADAGTPALRIVRQYLDGAGEVFEVLDRVHSAGQSAASSRLRRGRE